MSSPVPIPARLVRQQRRINALRFPQIAANDPVWLLASPQRFSSVERRLPAGSGLVLGAILGALCWSMLFAAVVHLTR